MHNIDVLHALILNHNTQ